MKIVGYGDRLSVQQGDTVRSMVSCRTVSYTHLTLPTKRIV